MSYISPFVSRYSSPFLCELLSDKERAITFRHLWIILAEIEKHLGLKISQEALDEMKAHVSNIDLERIKALEEITHHDVMAHIRAFGELAPSAQKIIHLGATSCFVTDNADIIIYKKALDYLLPLFKTFIDQLAELSFKHRHTTCVGYTHFQVAQPTTMGKRFCLWLQDLEHLYKKLKVFKDHLKLLGIKGATGTQSSFYVLFDRDLAKIKQMEEMFQERIGMPTFALSGQTYSRLQDAELVNICSEIGACLHKMGTDIRLLAHTGELLESFAEHQVGSSAMPHKKNPMLSERLCSLSRFLMQQSGSMTHTQATQWLERSLDDSAIRRVVMPQTLLALDAVLHLGLKLVKKLEVQPQTCLTIFEKNLLALAQEPILMHLALQGHDRQTTHEILKQAFFQHASFESYLKALQHQNLFLEPSFIQLLQDPSFYTATCALQVESFLAQSTSEM